MKSSARSSPLARIVLSHLAVLALATVAGNAYFAGQRETIASLLSTTTRKPIFDAASLAFQFGPADHARILFEELRRARTDDKLASGDTMFIELHLAALNGEHQSSGADTPHLASASSACKRLRSENCDSTRMRALAARFAEQRRN